MFRIHRVCRQVLVQRRLRPMIVLILGTGLYLQVRLGFMPLFKIIYGFRMIWKSRTPGAKAEGDAVSLQATLEELGFAVTLKRNISARDFDDAVDELLAAAKRRGEKHGVEVFAASENQVVSLPCA